ncbi:MAG: hypothetical protein V3U02_00345 [Calditrichia bacterium]
MTREEHMVWAKGRALGYVDAGDNNNAWASMCSDLNKHPETQNHPAIGLGMTLKMSGGLSSTLEMRKFIEGFN